MSVPHLIMQTWKTHKVPHHWLESPRSIRKHCPNWQYVLMTDEDNEHFVRSMFPDFWPYYQAFPYNIQRVDALRYMWLYIYGGVYMDLDLALTGSIIDDLSSGHDIYVVYSGTASWCVTNAFMASRPMCGFWLKVLEELKKPPPLWCVTKHLEVMNTTGPSMLNYCLREHGGTYRIRMLDYQTCTVCDSKPNTVVGSRLKTLQGSSWCGTDSMIITWAYCHRHELSASIVVFICILMAVILLGVMSITGH